MLEKVNHLLTSMFPPLGPVPCDGKELERLAW